MSKRLSLIDMFFRSYESEDELEDEEVKRIILEAFDADATKLDRVKALIRTAGQPWTQANGGLQKRLFDFLASEDFPLAVDIIIEGYPTGTVPNWYLANRVAEFKDPEQLRKAVGLMAASAREDFEQKMLEQENFVALATYEAVIQGMKRLIKMNHQIDEVRDLARAIVSSIEETEGVHYIPKQNRDRLLDPLRTLGQRPDAGPTRPSSNPSGQRKRPAPENDT